MYESDGGLFAAALSTILSLGLRAFDASTIRFATCKCMYVCMYVCMYSMYYIYINLEQQIYVCIYELRKY